jgi:hypothetical protein
VGAACWGATWRIPHPHLHRKLTLLWSQRPRPHGPICQSLWLTQLSADFKCLQWNARGFTKAKLEEFRHFLSLVKKNWRGGGLVTWQKKVITNLLRIVNFTTKMPDKPNKKKWKWLTKLINEKNLSGLYKKKEKTTWISHGQCSQKNNKILPKKMRTIRWPVPDFWHQMLQSAQPTSGFD